MTTWTQVAQVTLSREWQHIPATESKILRLRITSNQTSPVIRLAKGTIARAIILDGQWNYWGYKRIWNNAAPLILDFRNQPPPIDGAILAIRYWQAPQHPWIVEIDTPDGGYDKPEIPIVQCIDNIQPTFDGGYQ